MNQISLYYFLNSINRKVEILNLEKEKNFRYLTATQKLRARNQQVFSSQPKTVQDTRQAWKLQSLFPSNSSRFQKGFVGILCAAYKTDYCCLLTSLLLAWVCSSKTGRGSPNRDAFANFVFTKKQCSLRFGDWCLRFFLINQLCSLQAHDR
jgi:hypothetical protein